jgi:transposase
MWKPEHRRAADRHGLRYPSDLSNSEWALIEPAIPPAKHGRRRREVNVREVLNAIFYVLSTGCQWQALPKDLPPKSTAHSYFMLWDWDGTLGGSITHSMSRPASAKDARRARRPRSSTARALGPLKRMARPVGKQFPRANLSNLHQRIRSQGRPLAKMEIRASRAS